MLDRNPLLPVETDFTPAWFASQEVKAFAAALRSARIDFVFCGGAVRDAIDNRKAPKDFDIFVNTDLAEVESALRARDIRIKSSGPRRVVAWIGTVMFDIFTDAHADACPSKALTPEVLRDRVLNFDFTINTLILTPEGHLYDFFDAIADIRSGTVRAIVDPVFSFANKRVRITRYFRFLAEYGDTAPDAYMLEACHRFRNECIVIRREMRPSLRLDMIPLLSAPNPMLAVELMQEKEILPLTCGQKMESVLPFASFCALEQPMEKWHKVPFRIAAFLQGSSLTSLSALDTFSEYLFISDELRRKVALLLNMLPHMQLDMAVEKQQALIETFEPQSLEMLIRLRASQNIDIHAAQEAYLALLKLFSAQGYAAPAMGGAYVAFRQGCAPYTLDHVYGFTLIEMAIVLVIIGLIVGGVLVGRDLIYAAEVRSFVTQIEKYNTEAVTFYGKYNCLPGDCSQPQAQFYGLTSGDIGSNGASPKLTGFDSCGGYAGDGNGIVGMSGSAGITGCGDAEMVLFWQHLKDAGLFADAPSHICFEGVANKPSGFNTAMVPAIKFNAPSVGGQGAVTIFPGPLTSASGINVMNGSHLFWLTAAMGGGADGPSPGAAVLAPARAYAIDRKIDDSYPLTGTVQAAGDVDNGGPTAPSVGTGTTYCVNQANPQGYSLKSYGSYCSMVIKSTF
jgi:prepilin-type N-terminal cleavage/methylation domain-containing protein